MIEFEEFDQSIADEFGYAGDTVVSMFGAPLWNAEEMWHMLLRFSFHMLVCFIMIHFCYYRKNRNREYYKSLIFFSAGMFLLLFLLESIKLQIGLTLGLLAIFGVIRYRTETVPIKEMTYLFMVIAISVINGLSLSVSYAVLGATNLLILLIVGFFEFQRCLSSTSSKLILYDRIELITPDKHDELMADLRKRTGLNIEKIEIGHIDFLRDAAFIRVYYPGGTETSNTALNNITKLKPEL
ncbi:MAG: DUF4956 domain-containing protein [Muribaculaceae bacterium]|nr:DUF4956 domain-containing protein [Muribaculaceae bacterium]MBQ7853149.1 DUF4956 domain-containing protein [Muribaculaceae bacterium]